MGRPRNRTDGLNTLELLKPDRLVTRSLDIPLIRSRAAHRNLALSRPRAPVVVADGIEVVLVPDGLLDWDGAGKPVDIAFTVGGEMGYLTTVTPVVQRLLDRADVRVRPDKLDAELAAMVIETVLVGSIETLEKRLGGPIALLNLDAPRERTALASLGFELRMAGREGVYPGTLHGSAALLSTIARHWAGQPAIRQDVDGLMFTLNCRVAFTDLTASALRALAVGDAMLCDRIAVPGGAAVILAEALHATARFDEQGFLTLSDSFHAPERYALGDFLMTENDDGERPVQAIAEAAIDDLPVRLVFEVARKDVTLDELRSLGIGAPIPLDRPATSAVQVFANGRRIGAGEMVMIGEQLGVRITQLNTNA